MMPNISIRIENLDAFMDALKSSPAVVGKHLQQAVSKATLEFMGDTKQNIRQGTDMWKSPIDTGLMWNTITTSLNALVGTIYTQVDYAVYVHEGTSTMQARPFFEITANRSEAKISAIFKKEMDEAMDDIARRA